LSEETRIAGSVDDEFPACLAVEIAICHLKSILGETETDLMLFMCAEGYTAEKETLLYTQSCSYLSLHGWDTCYEILTGNEMKYPFKHDPPGRGRRKLPQKDSLPPLSYFVCAAAHNLRQTMSYLSHPDYHRTDKVTVMQRFATTMFQCRLPVTLARDGAVFGLQSGVLHVNLFQDPDEPRTDIVFASIHGFTDIKMKGAGFTVNYADGRRGLDFYSFPVSDGEVRFGLKLGVFESLQYAPSVLVYKKISPQSEPNPFLATTYIPDLQGLLDTNNLLGVIEAGSVGSFYLKRSAATPYQFRLLCTSNVARFISCRMTATPVLPTQEPLKGTPDYTFDAFRCNKAGDMDNFLMCIFIRALCFHMASRSGSDGSAEMCKFIMYTHDDPTPGQSLVTSGLLFSATNTWRDYTMEIPNFPLHKWVHSLPLSGNINERILYGGQLPLSEGSVEGTKKRKAK
jgi:hypothetical protein